MKVAKTNLDGVFEISTEVYEDFRGCNFENYNNKEYKAAGIIQEFVFDSVSISSKNVLRGIHGDTTTYKLISCLHGKIYLVVVDCDEKSENFGKWQSFILSDENKKQILVPPNYGNGHLVLSEKAVFHYKWSEYYDPKGQFTYKWNDKKLKIWWPIKNPILSRRDEEGKYV